MPQSATRAAADALVGLSCGDERAPPGQFWDFLPARYRMKRGGGGGGGDWRFAEGDLILKGVQGPSHANRGPRTPVETRWRQAKVVQRSGEPVLVHSDGELRCRPIPADRLGGYSATVGVERPVADKPSRTPEEARKLQQLKANKGRTPAEARLGELMSANWSCWGDWVRADIVHRHGAVVKFTLRVELSGGAIIKASTEPASEIAACLTTALLKDKDGQPRKLAFEGSTLEVPVEIQGWR